VYRNNIGVKKMKKGYVNIPEGQIHYRVEGEGEPVLLFHQAPMSSAEWEGVIPVLSKKYRVVAQDMIGHGNSDDPPREYEMEDFTRTTLQFMDALGIKKAIIGGNHTGSALALSIAVSNPERVSKLIMSCETLISTVEINAFLEMLLKKPMSRDIPMTENGSFLAEAWERYKSLAPSASLQTRFKPFIIGQAARLRPFDVHYAVFRWMGQADRMSQVKCPTLVFGAEKDLFFSIPLMESATKRIANCRTAIIKDAGAMCAFEKPNELGAAILKFLQG
jgi:pimeloyl-ACP methyl ester carboxylesterase